MYTTLKEVLKEVELLHVAIGAFNVHNLEMLPAIIKAAVHQKTPATIQTSCGTVNCIRHKSLVAVCHSMAGGYGVDVTLHLDHAEDYDEIHKAVDAGYNSVMFDGSFLPLKEDILGTKRVVDYIRARNVSVEAELEAVGGTKGGITVSQDDTCYTDPEDVVGFVKQTGIDALAMAIGTSHDRHKSETNISFERLKELQEAVDIPLVIHGGAGVKDEDVKRIVDLGIRKFDVDTELLVGWNRKPGECYDEHREDISNRDNVVPYLDTITEIVERKIHLFKNLDGE